MNLYNIFHFTNLPTYPYHTHLRFLRMVHACYQHTTFSLNPPPPSPPGVPHLSPSNPRSNRPAWACSSESIDPEDQSRQRNNQHDNSKKSKVRTPRGTAGIWQAFRKECAKTQCVCVETDQSKQRNEAQRPDVRKGKC